MDELTTEGHGVQLPDKRNTKFPLSQEKDRKPCTVVQRHFNIRMRCDVSVDLQEVRRELLLDWYKTLYKADNTINIKPIDKKHEMLKERD